jgi:hypothetical protein
MLEGVRHGYSEMEASAMAGASEREERREKRRERRQKRLLGRDRHEGYKHEWEHCFFF